MTYSPDPIIAAIERHRLARITLSRATRRVEEALAFADGRKVTAEHKGALRAASEDERLAFAEIKANPPRTNEGLAVFAAYIAEVDDRAMKDALFRVLMRSPLLTH
jgi:hypothetical protein